MMIFKKEIFFPEISGHLYQVITTIVGNLLTINYGMTFGTTSSMIVLYQSKDSPLDYSPITDNEASWITSYLCIGGMIGTILFGFLADKYGRRVALLISGIPQMIGWLCLAFGYKILHVYMSRFLAGLAGGGAFVVLPVYVSELAEDKTRGSLGSYITTFRNLGIVFGFIMGSFLTYEQATFIGLSISVAFNMMFPYADETPYFYVMKNNMEMVAKSLKHFRGLKSSEISSNSKYLSELERLKGLRSELDIKSKKSFELKDLFNWTIFKTTAIGLVLITTTQFCGVFALLNYSSVIFREAGINLSPNMSGIILALLQSIGAYMATLTADRIGRKILISTSSTIAGLSLTAFGFFIFIKQRGYDNQYMGPVLLLCLCITVFITNIGLYPLAFVVISEIFPQNLKTMFTTFFLVWLWFLAFLSVRYYYLIVADVGIHGCMWIFAGFCIFECVFTLIFVPETKGKSFDDVLKMLNR